MENLDQDDEEARNLLYANLAKKLPEMGSGVALPPEARAPLFQGQQDLADTVNRNSLYAALAKSAAQIGTIGGKSASAAPVEQAAEGMNRAAGLNEAGVQGEADKGDQDRRDLYKMLAQRSNLEFKVAKGQADLKHQVTTENEANRHNTATEKLGGQKLTVNVANAAARNDAQTARTENKDSKIVSDRFDKYTQAIKGTVRDSLGDEDRKLRVATHGAALLDQGKPLDNLSNIEVQELGGVLASQVTQGSPAESTLRHMTPQTAQGDLAKVFGYLTGKPEPANQGEFIDLYRHMLKRQIETSQSIIQSKLAPIVANYADLAQSDPEKHKSISTAAGISLDDGGQMLAYNPPYLKNVNMNVAVHAPASGTAQAAPATGGNALSHPEAPAARQWANEHRLDPDPKKAAKALEILNRVGAP